MTTMTNRNVGTIFSRLIGLVTLSVFMPSVQIFAQAFDSTNQPSLTQLERLQGTWEGVLVGQESVGKITINFTDRSLRFQGLSKSEWYEANFTLPAGTDPQQLRATITSCQQTNDIGTVVRAIFKIEDRTLTLAGIQDRDREPPKSFSKDKLLSESTDGTFKTPASFTDTEGESKTFEADAAFRYLLRRVQPQNKNAEAPSSK